jgi:hypothetical protein
LQDVWGFLRTLVFLKALWLLVIKEFVAEKEVWRAAAVPCVEVLHTAIAERMGSINFVIFTA